MEIQDILNKVIALNSKAINLNKENERRAVDKEYAKRDLETQLTELNKLNPNFNLSLDDPDFETKLTELKEQVVNKITQDTAHLEAVITAQESGDIAKLEELTGVFIGRKNLSDVVKLNEVPEDKSETIAIQDVESIEQVSSMPEPETPTQNTQASNNGLFEGMVEKGSTNETPETTQPTEQPVSNDTDDINDTPNTHVEEPTSVKDVQNLFSGMMQGGINSQDSDEAVVKQDTTETADETPDETPTTKAKDKVEPDTQPDSSTPDFNFGSFFK